MTTLVEFYVVTSRYLSACIETWKSFGKTRYYQLSDEDNKGNELCQKEERFPFNSLQ